MYMYDHRRRVSVRDKLHDLLQTIDRYCQNWRIKINFNKYETILFRNKVSRFSRDTKREWKNFKLINPTDNANTIEHKTSVKYLEVTLNQKYNFTQHALK